MRYNLLILSMLIFMIPEKSYCQKGNPELSDIQFNAKSTLIDI